LFVVLVTLIKVCRITSKFEGGLKGGDTKGSVYSFTIRSRNNNDSDNYVCVKQKLTLPYF